jgi:hypothetical protein
MNRQRRACRPRDALYSTSMDGRCGVHSPKFSLFNLGVNREDDFDYIAEFGVFCVGQPYANCGYRRPDWLEVSPRDSTRLHATPRDSTRLHVTPRRARALPFFPQPRKFRRTCHEWLQAMLPWEPRRST